MLATYLRRFYGELCNKLGKSYSKNSLFCIRAAIARHLNNPPVNYNYNILNDSLFKAANDVLRGKIRRLVLAGEHARMSYCIITEADINKMYESCTLSDRDPTSLQYKVFFEVNVHLGQMGKEKARNVKKEHILFNVDNQGREYAYLCPRFLADEHTPRVHNDHSKVMYGTGGKNCPMISLKNYISKLDPICSAFFQRPKVKEFQTSAVWYTKYPLGVNTICQFMTQISEKAGLSRRYTNQCIRATVVKTKKGAC